MSSLKSKVPEDAFYTNPFGVDEGDQVEMDDDDHDMFCTFGYFRARFTITSGASGTFAYQWAPELSYGSIRSCANAGSWNVGYPQYEQYLRENFSHFRICGGGMKFIPTMSSDSGSGEVAGGMYINQVGDVGADPTGDQPTVYQDVWDYFRTGDPSAVATALRSRRGTVEGSAMSGLQVNWRHLKVFNFNWTAGSQPDNGAAPAGGIGGWNFYNVDTKTFFPATIGKASTYEVSAGGAYALSWTGSMFPTLMLLGTGLPVSQNVGVLEVVIGVCGVAAGARVPSRTPKTVFLGASLTDDAMSNMPPAKEAMKKALAERAEQRGAKIWRTLDIASSVMRSLAPLGMMVNPAIGGVMGGASVATSALATNLRNFYSS